MELIRSIHNLRAKHRGCVATIGKFDGVHLGHKQLVSELNQRAQSLGVPSLVILFEPHPNEFFSTDNAPARLNTLATKLKYLAQLNIDRVLCLSFNAKLSGMSAEQFIREVLVDKLAIQHFVVGDDFRFGRGRGGNLQLIQEKGREFGFTVQNTTTYTVDGQRVSSSLLRQALVDHDFQKAAVLAGRPFSINGRVMHGQKLARTLGAPTANIKTSRYKLPLRGVFAVIVKTASRNSYFGVANIGKRPTVDGVASVLEVNIFDFSADLYGQKLDVEFKEFLRAERKFADLEQLKQAIFNDIAAAKDYFAAQNQ